MKYIVLATLFLAVTCQFLPKESDLLISKTFTLKPGKSGSGKNPLPFSVTGQCTVTKLTGTAQLCAYVLSGTASLTFEGKKLTVSTNKASPTCLSVKQGDDVSATVSGNADAYGIYKNTGNTSPMTVTCNANLDQALAIENVQEQPVGITKTFTVKPGQSGSGKDPLPFTVSGTCTITKLTGTATLCGYLESGSGELKLNGKSINLSHSKTDMTCMEVKQGDKASATADAGVSGYGIYKTGTSDLTVTCNANLQDEMTQMITKTFTVKVGEQGEKKDPLPFSASADCTIEKLTGTGVVCAAVLSGSVGLKLDGSAVTLSKSKSSPTCINVKQGDKLSASVGSGADAWGEYKSGGSDMTVTCNANLMDYATQLITKTLTVKPGQHGCGKDPLPFPITGTCKVTKVTGSATLCGYLTAGSGSINFNGKTVTPSSNKADPTCITVKVGDTLSANAGASVAGCGVYKTGTSPLTVTCTANL